MTEINGTSRPMASLLCVFMASVTGWTAAGCFCLPASQIGSTGGMASYTALMMDST